MSDSVSGKPLDLLSAHFFGGELYVDEDPEDEKADPISLAYCYSSWSGKFHTSLMM